MAEDEALLLWSADPLVSYRAVSSLLQRRPGDEDWLGAILAGALGSEASTSIPARGLTNLMEALRRVVVMVAAYAEDMDDETEEDGEKVELAPEAAAYVVTTVANAFSGLRG